MPQFKASIPQHSAFFIVQLAHPHVTTGKTIALTRWTFVGKVMSLTFKALPRLIIAFLPRRKRLFTSWLQSPSPVVLEPRKKSRIACTRPPSPPWRPPLNLTALPALPGRCHLPFGHDCCVASTLGADGGGMGLDQSQLHPPWDPNFGRDISHWEAQFAPACIGDETHLQGSSWASGGWLLRGRQGNRPPSRPLPSPPHRGERATRARYVRDYHRGTSKAVQWLRLHLHIQGLTVRSLVRELRSNLPHAPENQNIKQRQCYSTFNKDFKNDPHTKRKGRIIAKP